MCPFKLFRPCCRLPTHGFMVAPELLALLTRGGLTYQNGAGLRSSLALAPTGELD